MIDALNFAIIVLNCIAIVVLIALLVTLAAAAIKSLIDATTTKIYDAGRQRGREEVRLILHNEAWWYSEHGPTMHLLHNILERSGDWEKREEWRRELAEFDTRKSSKNTVESDRPTEAD